LPQYRLVRCCETIAETAQPWKQLHAVWAKKIESNIAVAKAIEKSLKQRSLPRLAPAGFFVARKAAAALECGRVNG
jgi:hypothetical protein